MKKLVWFFAAALFAGATLSSCDKKSSSLKSENDSLSYAIGLNIGSMFKENQAQIPGGKSKIDSVLKGFKKGLNEEQQSYVLGLSYGSNMVKQFEQMTKGKKVNEKVLLAAFEAALKDSASLAMKADVANTYLQSKFKR